VDLGHRADQKVAALSGGERSRCSLAVALLGEPELLILDEPTVGLDPVLRESLWRTFRAQVDAGRTILVSTHVMDEAQRCDHLVLMREGRVVAGAPPRRLLEETGAEDLEHAFIELAESSR
jgi:ABC-2 type transport system ATP-binding protein